MKGGEKRTGLDLKCALCDLLNSTCNPQAMEFPVTNRFENQKIESSLEEVCLGSVPWVASYRTSVGVLLGYIQNVNRSEPQKILFRGARQGADVS